MGHLKSEVSIRGVNEVNSPKNNQLDLKHKKSRLVGREINLSSHKIHKLLKN